MATIRDVAALAGVSPATVSRVLNGNHPVKASTRRAVEKAIRTLDFKPNLAGRNLRQHENKTILVITSSTSTEMFAQTMQGINVALTNEPYDVLTAVLLEDADDPTSANWQRCQRFLDGGLAGGVLLFGTYAIEAAAQAGSLSVPVVQLGENIHEHFKNSVYCSNTQATYELTKLLIGKGYRRFAFIGSQKHFETEPSNFSQDRLNGMKRAVFEANLEYFPQLTTTAVQQMSMNRQTYVSFLDTARHYAEMAPSERPDVIICATDSLAFACINALQHAGVRVPEDIAVTGFDNSYLAEAAVPALTTIQTPNMAMGTEAAKLLMSLMKGERPDGFSLQLPHRIIERESTR